MSKAADYLVSESGELVLGGRFSDAADAASALISSQPLLGRERRSRNSHLNPLRSLTLKRPFSRYVIFYKVRANNILVLRVLHTAQNANALLRLEAE